MATTTGESKTSFLDLPPELRNMVYRYSLVSPEVHLVRFGKVQHYMIPRPRGAVLTTALLLCCRQIRDEAILYGEKTFNVPVEHPHAAGAKDFFNRIGPTNSKYIRHFEIDTVYQFKANMIDLFRVMKKQNLRNLKTMTLCFTAVCDKFSEKDLAIAMRPMMRKLRVDRRGEDVFEMLRWTYEDRSRETKYYKRKACSETRRARRKDGSLDQSIEEYGARIEKLISETFK